METTEKTIDALLEENRVFEPSDEFASQANATPEIYDEAEDFEGFWARMAEELHWYRMWDKVVEYDPPAVIRWFIGGRLNASYNCVDRHVAGPKRNKAAIIWEGELGEERVLTYWDLYREVGKFANVLKGLGVKKGDRVAIYMPMIPELPIALLACARIGAPHSVVFGGFSAEALRERINDAEAKVIITADGGYRRGGVVQLKKAVDEALQMTPTVTDVVVVKRVGDDVEGMVCHMQEGRDHWWHELGVDAKTKCEPEEMDAEDMLYILYTSGSTGKPKGIVHTTGGYLVGTYTTFKYIFDNKDDDVFWCTADIGWVTGHSYVVYGPLANGATVVMYEGSPDFPDRGRWWGTIEKYGVTVLYTAPTAIRSFMKWGTEWPAKYDLSSLRLLGSVGEPINPEAWMWYHKYIGNENCPVADTWWQTETGMILITPLPGAVATKPGSATRPFPTVDADVFDENGDSVPVGAGGNLVVKKAWPSMTRTLYKDPERFKAVYWSKYPGVYLAGDGAKRDEDGYFWLLGRIDDVINISGHRMSTMEVESALVDHQAVAESAVIGIPHEIKGEAIAAFVILKDGFDGTMQMEKELKSHVRQKIGAIAQPEMIIFIAELPKTRSGKIMRRLLRDVAAGRALGDTTTLADPNVVAELKKKYENEE
ncbi:MAG: acetate--CoA ligase [Actinobacteria bacterium]|nr:acetate--CoA ligase [Actinomycetota bacterium]